MPHYRDGTEAAVGDVVAGQDWQGGRVVGEVLSISPNSTSCNMLVAYIRPMPTALQGSFTCGEFDKMAPQVPELAAAEVDGAPV